MKRGPQRNRDRETGKETPMPEGEINTQLSFPGSPARLQYLRPRKRSAQCEMMADPIDPTAIGFMQIVHWP